MLRSENHSADRPRVYTRIPAADFARLVVEPRRLERGWDPEGRLLYLNDMETDETYLVEQFELASYLRSLL